MSTLAIRVNVIMVIKLQNIINNMSQSAFNDKRPPVVFVRRSFFRALKFIPLPMVKLDKTDQKAHEISLPGAPRRSANKKWYQRELKEWCSAAKTKRDDG